MFVNIIFNLTGMNWTDDRSYLGCNDVERGYNCTLSVFRRFAGELRFFIIFTRTSIVIYIII